MKTLSLMLILTGAALLAAAPTASACDVEAPIQGVLCIGAYEDGWGDQTCEEVGYHKEGTYAVVKVPGVGGAIVDTWQYCFQGSHFDSEGTWVFAVIWVIDTADVLIMHSDWDGWDSGCFVIIVADTFATDPYSYRADCDLPA